MTEEKQVELTPSHGENLLNAVNAGSIALGHSFYHPNFGQCFRVHCAPYAANRDIISFVAPLQFKGGYMHMLATDKVVPA